MRRFISRDPYSIYRRKSADQAVTSSTTLVPDQALSFGVNPQEEWFAQWNLSIGAALATTGIQIAVAGPASTVIQLDAVLVPSVYAAANLGSLQGTTLGTALDFVIATQAGVASAQLLLSLWCQCATTPGLMQLQWAQSTSSGTALTMRKGSFMQAYRVA